MKITGRMKKLHVVKLHNMWSYLSLSMLRIITPKFIRCVGHLACRGEILCKIFR